MSTAQSSLRRFMQQFCHSPTFISLRLVEQQSQSLVVTRNIIEPPSISHECGVMICVEVDGQQGFAATSDITQSGLRYALDRASQTAKALCGRSLLNYTRAQSPPTQAHYRSPELDLPVPDTADWLALLMETSQRVPTDPRLAHWSSSLRVMREQQLYLDNQGNDIQRSQQQLFPALAVTAFDGHESQHRTYHLARQGGASLVTESRLIYEVQRMVDEALQLLLAPNTPEGPRDVLLMPDQMILQIHESIGHPLELDRILGDERNYAGTSFVTPEMFGHYRYGSELLNVSFDPSVSGELASYSHDDEGLKAEKHLLIEKGILQRPLGGALSQARSEMPGVANSRACNWNRAPIDRMANLNIEPGEQSMQQLIGGIEHGILMSTNRSWSIDDARNKFQFGCEWGQLIENGELGGVVKNPNYRGISSQFWRNLRAVGNASTFSVMGTPNCGKGEPNQAVTVGHASPACVFSHIDVFGGQI
ncbi:MULTISPECIES: TldD/PmbA family protein [Pseudomonas]|nr:Metalloprotease TldD [Pseudomonas carnis]CAH0286278.1 Metalloprotease TldD [Pseudomonas carnis]CAH0309174.1 Metalloprotease TldD [Pseudomonas carnis]CAH0315743.1 Metalloprotease TldD [Pseudomonas carnis]